jgi:crotonobetainyl-CoA:carnitine CoA-transferase CaiB-like acyl-CoA transferase
LQALDGIKVVELTAWALGPAAGAVLGDWGAEIIKIEDPVAGDPLRTLERAFGVPAPKKFTVFDVDNRNKRSIAIDLKGEKGREIVYSLIKEADIFITNYRATALDRLKMDYGSLSAVNPRLIYAFGTGYGENGAEKNKAGFDSGAYWARSGLLVQLGPDGAPPTLQYAGLGDQPTGLALAGGIALALYARERTGKGQKVSVSLLRVAAWNVSLATATAMEYGGIPRMNRRAVANPLASCYQAKDGKWIQLLMLQADRFWTEFCSAMGLNDVVNDPKFNNMDSRFANREEFIAILDKKFAEKDRAEWIEIFRKTDIMWDPGNTFHDLTEDPQALDAGCYVTMEHPSKGSVKITASPITLNGTDIIVRRHAPEHGEQTEEVLLEMGYTWEDITALKEAHVII